MVTAFALVWLREDMPKGDLRAAMLEWHQWAGLLILLLLLPRLLARWHGVVPLHGVPLWQRVLARVTEAGLYLLMIVQPLAGWTMTNLNGHSVSLVGLPLPALVGLDRGAAEQLAELHEICGTLILVLVGLHVLAALYHHFWRRDRVLYSMLGSKAPPIRWDHA